MEQRALLIRSASGGLVSHIGQDSEAMKKKPQQPKPSPGRRTIHRSTAARQTLPNGTANLTNTTTISGGINITGASDPQASGKAVAEAIRDNDDDLSFAVDTGVRQ